jgi:hypothetical protein
MRTRSGSKDDSKVGRRFIAGADVWNFPASTPGALTVFRGVASQIISAEPVNLYLISRGLLVQFKSFGEQTHVSHRCRKFGSTIEIP